MTTVVSTAVVLLAVGLFLRAAAAALGVRRRRAQLTARLEGLDRKLDAVVAHLGVTVPEPETSDLVRLLEQGERTKAIKMYRERSSADLITARNFVDALDRRRDP